MIIVSLERGDEVYISEHIIEEATRVILKKFPDHIELFENFIETSSIRIVKIEDYIDSIIGINGIRDMFDAHVIACAQRMNCDYIISGDKDLLTFSGSSVIIITSKEYLSMQ